MWTVLIFLNLWALYYTVSSSPPSPVNVIFSSVNLRNVLQWSPGNGTPADTHFTVQYAIYGDSVKGSKGRRANWRAVRQCTDIVRRWCDLSSETRDFEQGYYARVRAVRRRASSRWVSTPIRFDPKSDTIFGPPLVSVDIEDNSAIITLKGPMRYEPNNHTPAVSMATFYSHMIYNLSIHSTRRGRMSHFLLSSNPYKYRLMEYDTEYCFSAKTRFLSMPVQCQSSEWHCITTPPDPVTGQLQRVIVGIAVPSVCMCFLVVVGYLLYHYLTGKGQKSPYILNPPSFHPPPLTFPPENVNVRLFTFIKDEPSEAESGISDPEWQIADPPPRYNPQRSETPPEPEEPWDDVSIDYGFLAVAPKIDARGEEGERERKHDREEDGNNLRGQHQKCTGGDSNEKQEWRVEDGPSTGLYAPQAKSHLSQRSTYTCSQTHTPIHTHVQTEMSTFVQAQAWPQVNSLTQTQKPLLSLQGETNGEFSGLFRNKPPQTGLFHIPLILQTKKGMGEEVDGKVRVRPDGEINGGVEEGSQSQGAPLLSAYASQNIRDMPPSDADQSDFLQDDYGVLRVAAAHNIEGDEEEEEEEEEEETTICINWDPMTRKLVLPEMAMEFSKEGGLDETRMGGEEEVYVKKGKLTLENVFVRQASEEETEAKREMERGGETSREADDILTKWNLVISMDQ